jgi:drug/metabolite transporter, DME family
VLSLVSTYLAYLAYYTGLRRTEASRAVLVATVEPVAAAAWRRPSSASASAPWLGVGRR